LAGTYQISQEFGLNAGSNLQTDYPSRYFLVLQRNGRNLSDPSFNLGVSYQQEQAGIIAGISSQIYPGLLLRLEYQSQPPFQNFNDGNNPTFFASLSTDLSFSRGQIRPGQSGGINNSQGAISGQIKPIAKQPLNIPNLSGSLVSITNQGATRTDAQGNFFIGNLRPGVYVVELSPETLPVEFTLLKNQVIAEVAAGAITNIIFPIQAEFGIAGRIRDSMGQPVPNLVVEVLNNEGKVIKTGRSDQFGLYRVDGLVPNTYTVQIAPSSIPPGLVSVSRSITIVDDFLFEQDLELK
jgi:hypothetical protein